MFGHFNTGNKHRGYEMNRMLKMGVLGMALAIGFTIAGHAADKTLYDNLGGKKAIVAVVDEFVARVAADKRINAFFAATAADPKRLASFKGKV